MSLQWEPQWEETIIEVYGVRLKVPRDRVTGLYACPICGFGVDATYFFSEKDLVIHILNHAKVKRAERVKVQIVEPGEPAEEKLEEEED
ncbi:hypothetical protein [Hyperthermus butylicus]|uniref:Uncharacterized protein n=1 Tax=Hyperthermus butylicus (strain DSM 5456 / JCM 9403 / PLM1-5) TaxID=415426 RepID=A2BM77_HYPBU|nr:hypothetical protein [Hyperthermus butylicus]ABM81088.1 hypothetical protein Hbut_1256 [Hyperthermus butylicus DSM 5456]